MEEQEEWDATEKYRREEDEEEDRRGGGTVGQAGLGPTTMTSWPGQAPLGDPWQTAGRGLPVPGRA